LYRADGDTGLYREREKTDTATAWASAHRGKWGQLTLWKMDEKLKSENKQKRAVF